MLNRTLLRSVVTVAAVAGTFGVLALATGVPAHSAPSAPVWSVSGAQARMSLHGITVTATLSGPGNLKGDGAALGLTLQDCADDCGSLTYTFSGPVQDLHLGVAGMGAKALDDDDTPPAGYHSITVRDGVFVPVSQSPRMAIVNGGHTVALTGPGTEPGAGVCGPSGCSGTYRVSYGPAPVTALRLAFGHGGAGTGPDSFSLTLGLAPAPAQVAIATAPGSPAGEYSFELRNLSAAALEVHAPGPSGVPAAPAALAVLDPGAPVTIAIAPPPGVVVAAATCTSGDGTPVPTTLSGNTLTLTAPAANLAPTVCTFDGATAGPVVPSTPQETSPPPQHAQRPATGAAGPAMPSPSSAKAPAVEREPAATVPSPSSAKAPTAEREPTPAEPTHDPGCAAHAQPALAITGDHTVARTGDTITYTVHATAPARTPVSSEAAVDFSRAAGILHYTGDAAGDYSGRTLLWPLNLGPGEETSMSFTMTVEGPAAGTAMLSVAAGDPCTGQALPGSTAATTVLSSVPSGSRGDLASLTAPGRAAAQTIALSGRYAVPLEGAGSVLLAAGATAMGLEGLRLLRTRRRSQRD